MNLCTHLRWVGLHRGQIVLQGQAAVVVEYGLHSDQMGLHQPLPLSGDLLLERLQHRLEVLMEEGRKREDGVNLGLFSFTHGLLGSQYLIQGLSLCLGQIFGLVVCLCPFLHDLRSCRKEIKRIYAIKPNLRCEGTHLIPISDFCGSRLN